MVHVFVLLRIEFPEHGARNIYHARRGDVNLLAFDSALCLELLFVRADGEG